MQGDSTWTDARIELIKRTIVPKGIPLDEFLLFIEQCKRSGLDPLLKQAFCVPREAKGPKVKNPDGSDKMEQWSDRTWHPVFEKVVRYEFQPSRDGMLVRANRFPDFLGLQASEVYAEDDILVKYTEDGAASTVRHEFNPAKRKGALVGAWARVVREGKLPVVVWVDFSAYVQQSPLWKTKAAVMICKVAEATALRKAYPEAFGGLYIAGERPDDMEQEEEAPTQAPIPISRVSAPTLPAESATRQATPVLEQSPAQAMAETPVTDPPYSKESTRAEPPKEMTEADEMDMRADSIIQEAERVAGEVSEAGKTEAALAQAKKDLEALGARARKLPKGPARERVGAELLRVKQTLFQGDVGK